MDYQSTYRYFGELDVNLDTGCLTLLIKLTWDPAVLLPPAANHSPEKKRDAEQAGRHQQLRQHHHDLCRVTPHNVLHWPPQSPSLGPSLQEKPGTGCLQASAQLVAVDVGLTEFSAGLTTRRCCTGAPRKPPQSPPQLFPFFLLYVSIVLYSFCNDVLSIIHLKHLTREI